MASFFQVDHITKSFGGLVAVNNVSFTVEKGQIVGLIGPNGAGKTTCFNLVSGFLKPDSGTILWKGDDITKYPPYKIAANGIVRTFQHASVLNELSIEDNVLAGMHLSRKASALDILLNTRKFREERESQQARAREIMQKHGFLNHQAVIAQNLSYGNQRILQVAIALAANPDFLLLDEPAAGLNPVESLELIQLINRLRDEGVTVLLIDHNMKVIMNMCDKVIVLSYGKKIAEGTPKEVGNNPEVIEVYLGKKTHEKVVI